MVRIKLPECILEAVKGRAFRRHMFVGVLTYLITISILHTTLSVLGLSTLLSLAILQTIIYVYGFLVTSRFIYKDDKAQYVHSQREQAIRYGITLIGFRLFDGAVSFVLIDWLAISYFLVPLMVTGALFILKFFVYRQFIFTSR